MEELIALLQEHFAQLSEILGPSLGLQERRSSSEAEPETSVIQELQFLEQTSSAHRLITDFQNEL